MPRPKKPDIAGDRILGGAFYDEALNFMFVVWAYRPLSEPEMKLAYSYWNSRRDKRRTLKGKQVDVISHF